MRHILITGLPGIGKTTLIKKLVCLLHSAGGFYTEEIRKGGKRIGFKIVTLDGKEGLLAGVFIDSPYRVGKYGVNVKDVEEIAVPAIRAAVKGKDYVVIDEIARMELFSEEFKRAVKEAFESEKRVIATIQVSKDPFLEELRKREDVLLYELKLSNREKALEELKKFLMIEFPG